MKKQHRFRTWLAAAGIVAVVAASAACASSSARKPSAGPPGGTDASGTGASENLKSTALGAAAPDANRSAAGAPAAANNAYASGDAAGHDGGAQLPSLLDRKIIMVATVDLNVDDVARSFEDVSSIAAAAGGFVASSSFGHNGDNETASVTIRVPGDKYQDALTQLRKLGKVRDTQSSSNDVTEEYTDLQSRLRNLRATEEQYLAFLGRAGSIGDVLQVQDRLSSVRSEIEQVQGRINLVEHQTDLATITVHLDPPIVEQAKPTSTGGSRGPLEVAADAFQASLDVLLGIATVALAVAAFSWWLLPLAALGWFLGRRQLRPRAP